MHSNFLPLVLNCVFSESDKFANNVVGRVGAIVKKHLNVFYAHVKEMAAIIELVVESGNKADVFAFKNVQNAAELVRNGPGLDGSVKDTSVWRRLQDSFDPAVFCRGCKWDKRTKDV